MLALEQRHAGGTPIICRREAGPAAAGAVRNMQRQTVAQPNTQPLHLVMVAIKHWTLY